MSSYAPTWPIIAAVQGSLGLGLLGLGGLACSIGAAAVGPSPSPFGAAASLQHAQPLSLYPTHQQLHLHHHKDNSLRLLQQHRYQQSAGVRGGPGGGGGGALLASGGRCLSLPTRPTVFSAAGGPGACGSLAATMGTVSDPFLELQVGQGGVRVVGAGTAGHGGGTIHYSSGRVLRSSWLRGSVALVLVHGVPRGAAIRLGHAEGACFDYSCLLSSHWHSTE